MNTKTQNRSRTTSTLHRAMFAALLTQVAGTAAALGQAEPATNHVTAPSQPRVPETRPLPVDATSGDTGVGMNAAGEGTAATTTASDKVKVDENNIVDLHVNDEELSNVLEMLSIQSQQNIVASKAVSARVTANLYGVTFFEALDAILNVNGFGYVKQGNFIYVYTKLEIEQLAKEQRQKVSKVINLNYLNAVDAAEFVKPLLSEAGQIKTNGKTTVFPTRGAVPVGNDEYAGNATLVVIDFDDHVTEVENLIKQLDTRPAQVLVEATILQTTLTEANAFGVDFSIIADMNFGDFVKLGGPLSAANALIGGATDTSRSAPLPADRGGSALSSTVGNTSGPGGLKVGVVSNDVAVFMRVLDEVSDTTILSNPKILALNRQASRVLVGRKVGYLSTTSTDTATTQTVEFLDTGTQLNFRPFVTNEGMVRMELKPQVSEAVIRETNDSTGKQVTIPDEITNELVTNVLVGDGQTVVLGGLFREQTQSARRQIPFLGDIPVIGQAFRGNDDSTNRSEIIFMVTPTIVNDMSMTAAGQRGKMHIETVRAGSREGLLYWSREKMTSRMNVEADRLAQSGDTEKALWKINRSLSLNHNQPEAVALRERLTGEKSQWPDRSFLERVIHGDAQKMSTPRKVENAESPDMPGVGSTVPAAVPANNDNHDEVELEQANAHSSTPSFAGETQNFNNNSNNTVNNTHGSTAQATPESTVSNTPANANSTFNPPVVAEAIEPTSPEGEGFDNATDPFASNNSNNSPTTEAFNNAPATTSDFNNTTSNALPADNAAAVANAHNGDFSNNSNNSNTLNNSNNIAVNTPPAVTVTPATEPAFNPGTEFARLWLGRSGVMGGSWAFFKSFGFQNSGNAMFTKVQEGSENADNK